MLRLNLFVQVELAILDLGGLELYRLRRGLLLFKSITLSLKGRWGVKNKVAPTQQTCSYRLVDKTARTFKSLTGIKKVFNYFLLSLS